MVKCCEHVNCCLLLVWIRRLVWANGDSPKGSISSSSLAPGPLPFPFSRSHIRAQTEGNTPQRLVVFSRAQLLVPRRDSQPRCKLAQTLPSPTSTPPNCCQSPWDGFLQCVVLSVPCCYSNPKKIFVTSSLKWRHLHAILKIFVRVLIYCFDQLFLTYGVPRAVQEEKTCLGKQMLPRRAPCLWISVPSGVKAHSQVMNAWNLNSYPTPAQEGGWANQKAQVRTPSEFTSVKGVATYVFMQAHVSPKNSAPYTCLILRGDRRWHYLVLDSRFLGFAPHSN